MEMAAYSELPDYFALFLFSRPFVNWFNKLRFGMKPHNTNLKATVQSSGSFYLDKEIGKKQDHYNYEKNLLIKKGYLT